MKPVRKISSIIYLIHKPFLKKELVSILNNKISYSAYNRFLSNAFTRIEEYYPIEMGIFSNDVGISRSNSDIAIIIQSINNKAIYKLNNNDNY